MEKTFDEDDNNSTPKLPDTSMGSSVSTDMENEYNELLQYTLVLPVNFEPNSGPKILENIKGLFSTKGFQAKSDKTEKKAEEGGNYNINIEDDQHNRNCNNNNNKENEPEEVVKIMSSTENDFQFMKADSSDSNKSLDLINFDQSVIEANSTILNLNEGKGEQGQEEQSEETEQQVKTFAYSNSSQNLTQDNSKSNMLLESVGNEIKLEDEKINNNLINNEIQNSNKLINEIETETASNKETHSNIAEINRLSYSAKLDLATSISQSQICTTIKLTNENVNKSSSNTNTNSSQIQADGQLSIDQLGKTFNSLTIVSELNNASTNRYPNSLEQFKENTNDCFKIERDITSNEKGMNDVSQPLSPSSSSPTSLTSASSSTSPSANNDSTEIIQHLIHSNFNSSNDINPRKHSPIPASPPSNVEFDPNVSTSLEHLTSSNSKNYHQRNYQAYNSNELKSHKHKLNKLIEMHDNNSDAFVFSQYHHRHNYQQHHDGSSSMTGLQDESTKATNGSKNVKNVATCMDKWYKELKGQVLSEFEKSRVQLLQEQQKKLIEEKEKQTAEIIKLKKEMEISRERLKVYEKNILRKDEAIENLSKAFEKQREKTELLRVMMDWKLKRQENAKEAFTEKLAEKYHTTRVKLKAFICWQNFLITKRKTKLEKACKKKAEEVCYELATKYETKIKSLEEELNSSKAEIEKYKLEMAKHEESMKKALMRGVCAFNMEAMSIFNDKNTKTDQTHQLAEHNPNISTEHTQMPLYSQFAQTSANFFKSIHSSTNTASSNGGSIANLRDSGEYQHHPHYQPSYYASNYSSSLAAATSRKYKPSYESKEPSQQHTCKLSDRESKDLSKKVRNFCESSLKKSNGSSSGLTTSNDNLNQLNNNTYSSTSGNMSALSRAKLQLLNSTNHQEQQQHQQYNSYESSNASNNRKSLNSDNTLKDYEYDSSTTKLVGSSTLKKYDELKEHPLPAQQNKLTTSKYSNVKAKVGSLPTVHSYSSINSTKHLSSAINCPHHCYTNTTSASSSRYSTHQPTSHNHGGVQPYRSVLIEKHTPSAKAESSDNIKTTTSQVKYAMPMQSAKVLNKVVTNPMP